MVCPLAWSPPQVSLAHLPKGVSIQEFTIEGIMGFSTKESDIVRSVLDWLAFHKILAWRTNNTGIYDPSKKTFRSFHGRKGVSDIIGVFPQTVRLDDGTLATFGNLMAIETKIPGKSLRPEQAEFLSQVRESGGIGICVH